MRIMKIIPQPILMICWLMVGLTVLVGCKAQKPVANNRHSRGPVYRVVIRDELATPSAQVIQAVRNAIKTTQLEFVSGNTTNIDGLFYVQSALRKEFKIVVIALTLHRTRIEISTVDREDKGLAQIIYDRIRSSLPESIES